MQNIYLDLLNRIVNEGTEVEVRGLKVKELTNLILEVDPTLPFPNFSDRPFNDKYFDAELVWYKSKEKDINYIQEYSKFWKKLTNPGTNEVNSNYGNLLFGDQLKWVYDALKEDKFSRQAVAFLNNPNFQFPGNKDFVCTMYLNFWIRDNKLNMKVQMRSNDFFFGLTYDVPFFSYVMQNMMFLLRDTYPELELGTYYHCADNVHIYERHYELADTILSSDNPVLEDIKMVLDKGEFSIEGDNFVVAKEGYKF